MGLTDLLFGNAISKRVSEQLATKQSVAFTSALQRISMGLNEALPTINPDGVDHYQTFKTIGAVYEVTDAIAKKVLNCPIIAYKIKNKTLLQKAKAVQKTDPVQAFILKAQAIEEVDVTELQKLLSTGNANPYQTGSQVLWGAVVSYLLKGNTFLHGIKAGKKTKELYCFPNMTIAADIEDLLDPIRGYILQNTSQQRFEKEEIQHIKTGTPAPIDRTMEYLYGVSPLRAYFESVRGIKVGKQQSSKQAKNGGTFGFVSPKNKEDQLDKPQKTDLKDRMVDGYNSNDPISRIFPSSISLDWTPVGLSSADLQLLEYVSASEEDIYRAYHWPLQFHNQKASTSNNQATAVKQGVYDAVAPVCDIFGEALTVFLAEGFGVDVIELDYTQLPEMAVNMKDVAVYLNSLPKGVITYNEMRVILKYGEKTDAYMNEHYVESGLTTLKRVYEDANAPKELPPATPPPASA